VPAELTEAVESRGVQVADWKKLYEELQAVWEKRYGEMKGLFERSKANARENHDKWLELSERSNGLIASFKERISVLEREAQQAAAPTAEKSLSTKERESLLKLVIGMAVAGYGYDPKAERSQQIPEIANDLALAGVTMDADTVRKWLRAAAQLLPPLQPPALSLTSYVSGVTAREPETQADPSVLASLAIWLARPTRR
jgi:hypothetical protein